MAHRVLAIFRRRLFNLLTILSLLLCLATVALWVRSYWRYDFFTHISGGREGTVSLSIQSNFGSLATFSVQDSALAVRILNLTPGWSHATMSASPILSSINMPGWYRSAGSWRFLGFADLQDLGPYHNVHAVCLPHWFPALLFAILPAIRLRSILRTRRRHRSGLCPHCGYDLRATPDRCPECGHVRMTG